MTLNELANKHGTDKGDGLYERHDYAKVYDQLITDIVRAGSEDRIRMLEIGVWDPRSHGASIRMWREWLPLAEIHGVDIVHDSLSLEGECRVKIHLADQGDLNVMEKLSAEIGSMDFVVDDGSHVEAHQVTSFRALWPNVKPGGFYAIEDLHAYAPCTVSRPPLEKLVESLGGQVLHGTVDKLLIALKAV